MLDKYVYVYIYLVWGQNLGAYLVQDHSNFCRTTGSVTFQLDLKTPAYPANPYLQLASVYIKGGVINHSLPGHPSCLSIQSFILFC